MWSAMFGNIKLCLYSWDDDPQHLLQSSEGNTCIQPPHTNPISCTDHFFKFPTRLFNPHWSDCTSRFKVLRCYDCGNPQQPHLELSTSPEMRGSRNFVWHVFITCLLPQKHRIWEHPWMETTAIKDDIEQFHIYVNQHHWKSKMVLWTCCFI